jgi:hypothetical protein
MKKELRENIIAYNKRVKEKGEKSDDMEVLINALAKLPWGQLKKLLSDEVLEVLKKYGFEV